MNKDLQKIIQKDCEEITTKFPIDYIDQLKNECILISGGTGFFGTWLAEFISFLNDHFSFNIKLILLSERAYNFSERAPHLAIRKDITLIARDITSLIELPSDVSMIIHAAGNPDNRMHASDPLRIAKVIVNGTAAMLDAAIRSPNIKKIVNISSGLIYGSQPQQLKVIPENYIGGPDCNSGSSVYAEAKRYAEMLCSIYRTLYKLEIITIRPFAFIGPYQLLDRPWAINNFIRDCLKSDTIRILGDGQTVRSYMYPSDMAFWILRILSKGSSGVAYNMGSPHGITLLEIAEKISTHFLTKPKIVSNLSFAASQQRSLFVPDITRVQSELNLKITVDIDEAINRTLTWFRTRIEK